MENNFSANLKFLRKKDGFTLEELGKALNISKSAISDYENGKSLPNLEVTEKISKHFKLPIDALQHARLAELSATEVNMLRLNEQVSGSYRDETGQLSFHNKLLEQQLKAMEIQLQLVQQIVVSKDSEIQSLRIQVRLLEEKIAQS